MFQARIQTRVCTNHNEVQQSLHFTEHAPETLANERIDTSLSSRVHKHDFFSSRHEADVGDSFVVIVPLRKFKGTCPTLEGCEVLVEHENVEHELINHNKIKASIVEIL